MDRLRKAREVSHYQQLLGLILPNESQNLPIVGMKKLDASLAEGVPALAQMNRAFHPPKQRVRIALLRLDVDRFVVILRIENHRQIEGVRCGAGEAGIFI